MTEKIISCCLDLWKGQIKIQDKQKIKFESLNEAYEALKGKFSRYFDQY